MLKVDSKVSISQSLVQDQEDQAGTCQRTRMMMNFQMMKICPLWKGKTSLQLKASLLRRQCLELKRSNEPNGMWIDYYSRCL